MVQTSRRRKDDLALTCYGLRLGALVEQHMAKAALVAARQEAEREAEEAKKAKREIEATNATLREEMAIRLENSEIAPGPSPPLTIR